MAVNAVDFAHALHSSDEGPSNEAIATVISTLKPITKIDSEPFWDVVCGARKSDFKSKREEREA